MVTTVSGSARALLFVLLGTASVEPPALIGREERGGRVPFVVFPEHTCTIRIKGGEELIEFSA